MIAALANPERFMAFSRWAAPLLGAVAAALLAVGLWLGFRAPPDYQQGDTVRIMFIHVPAAWIACSSTPAWAARASSAWSSATPWPTPPPAPPRRWAPASPPWP